MKLSRVGPISSSHFPRHRSRRRRGTRCAASSASFQNEVRFARQQHASYGMRIIGRHAPRPRTLIRVSLLPRTGPQLKPRQEPHQPGEPPHRRRNCVASTIIAGIVISSASPPVRLFKARLAQATSPPARIPLCAQAAIDALGDMNGTAVVIDPSSGRILAMVNQKLALSPGAEPCSTIKLTVALAALSEGLVTSDTMVQAPGLPHEHDPGAGQEQQPLL